MQKLFFIKTLYTPCSVYAKQTKSVNSSWTYKPVAANKPDEKTKDLSKVDKASRQINLHYTIMGGQETWLWMNVNNS